ncbi:MAG: choice-of-anchor Q domain-containing protein [Lysobacterales bacterium]
MKEELSRMNTSGTLVRKRWARVCLAMAITLCALSASAQVILPTHWLIVVGTNSDANLASGCSLRQAVESHNAGANVGDCERLLRVGSSTNRIKFDAALVPGQIFLSQQLGITTNMIIEGPGADIFQISGSTAHRIFNITSAADVVIRGLTLTQGRTELDGGAIASDGALTVADSRILNSSADGTSSSGGAIATDGPGLLTIQSSELSGHSANWLGGAVHARGPFIIKNSTLSGNQADYGGALMAVGDGSLEDTVVADNTTRFGASLQTFNAEVSVLRSSLQNSRLQPERLVEIGFTGSPDNSIIRVIGSLVYDASEGLGGFAMDDGVEFGNSELILRNSTVTGSRGIVVRNKLELINTTVAVSRGIAVRFNSPNAEGRIANSIVVSEVDDDCVESNATIVENSYNIYTDGNCTSNQDSVLFTDPLLGPLQDNGGPTLTRMPLPTSPAIDAGSLFCQTLDQRYFNRTDGLCDIGAVEVGATDGLFSDGFEGS